MLPADSMLRQSSLYKARNKVSLGSRRTSWFVSTAPGVPHVAATYFATLQRLEQYTRLELVTEPWQGPVLPLN